MSDKLIAFTKNMEDNSTEAGFGFTFFCDICNAGYKTRFVESTTFKKGKLFRGLGRAASAAGQLTGHGNIGSAADTGSGIISDKFEGMTPEWHKEHEKAFEDMTREAQGHFKRCPKCYRFVCDNDWNEEAQLCVDDAPREAVEVSAARSQKMKQDIEAKAAQTQVFSGEITERQTLCPKCGKPAGAGKFCNNCGAPLGMLVCPKCGAQSPIGTRFCGECGGKLG
ncbi:MAG: zinc ribbon domain-containing protein [Methanomassiliicoccales archaeon]|nr:zinc ribbon domain-containing protein [Methanomassiliicoccales archaeon]